MVAMPFTLSAASGAFGALSSAHVKPLDLVAPLAIPPRLLVRALDDLHTIAASSREMSRRLASLERGAEAATDQLQTAIALLRQIEGLAEQVLSMAGRADARAEEILAFGERIELRVGDLLKLGDRADDLGAQMLAQAEAIQLAAREVAVRGGAVADALPPLQRALEIAEPLEGAVERLGRIVDRLPGGSRRAPERPGR